jgi:hypothetical protein
MGGHALDFFLFSDKFWFGKGGRNYIQGDLKVPDHFEIL